MFAIALDGNQQVDYRVGNTDALSLSLTLTLSLSLSLSLSLTPTLTRQEERQRGRQRRHRRVGLGCVLAMGCAMWIVVGKKVSRL